MDKLLSLTGLKWLVAVGLVVAGLVFWINWSFDMSNTVTTQKDTIADRDKTIKELRGDIEDWTTGKKKLAVDFSKIDDSQVDLLCAARYNAPAPLPAPSEPVIKEVTVYRDRISQCPTTDVTKAETFDPTTAELRPVNEGIAITALNNSWKAYCLATNNEDESCAPFR